MTQPMAAWRLSYTGGRWLALSGPTSLVIMMTPPASASSLVAELWEGTLRTSTPDALLRFLSDSGIAAMPHLGAFFWDGDGLHGLVRGDVRVTDADSGDVVLSDPGSLTWAEQRLDPERTYTIDLEEAAPDQAVLPLVVGAALVSSVALTAAPDQRLVFPTAEATGLLADLPPVAGAGAQRAAAEDDAQEPTRATDLADAAAATAPGPGFETRPFDPSALDEVASASSPQSIIGDRPSSPPPFAPPPVEPLTAPSAAPPPMAVPIPPPSPTPLGTRSEPVVVPGSFGEVDDDPGTIFSTGIAATHKPAAADASHEEQVLAVPCVQGHPNPPGARQCRICQAPVDPSNPRLLRRPLLAGVNTNHGEFADVVTAVIVGRAPDASHGPQGSHLLRVPSPGNDISRSHLMVTTRDWNIVVTDLHSTNGTTVRPVGEPEFELRDGRSVTVEIGTILDLGDGVSLRIEPPRSG